MPGLGCGVSEHQYGVHPERTRGAEHPVQRGGLAVSIARLDQRRVRPGVKFKHHRAGMPWDIGSLAFGRIDAGALGMPISATTLGALYICRETTANAAGAPITASFQTGFFISG